jgi:hypothetical protein
LRERKKKKMPPHLSGGGSDEDGFVKETIHILSKAKKLLGPNSTGGVSSPLSASSSEAGGKSSLHVAAGRITEKVVPFPGSLLISIRPRCAWITW